jgi:hypothetical protein
MNYNNYSLPGSNRPPVYPGPFNRPSVYPVYPQQNSNNQYLQLQMRISQARQANIMYKQQLGRMLVNNNNNNRPSINSIPDSGEISLSSNYRSYEAGPPLSKSSSGEPSFNSNQNTGTGVNRSAMSPSVSIRPPSTSTSNVPADAVVQPSPSKLPSSNYQQPYSLPTNYQKQIHSTLDLMHSNINSHKKLLEDCKSEQISARKRDEIQKKLENQQARDKIVSLLQEKSNSNDPDHSEENKSALHMLPLWKHKANGNNNPPRHLIMNNYRLFRIVAQAIFCLVVIPQSNIYKRRKAVMAHNKNEFSRTLHVVVESLGEWMGKIVQLPISSVVTVKILLVLAFFVLNFLIGPDVGF